MITHHPFDYGALDFLSSCARQKTIKAVCGARVPFANARAHLPVSCPSCRATLAQHIADARAFRAQANADTSPAAVHVRAMADLLDKRAADLSAVLAR